LTQILTWIRDHVTFIEDYVEPMLKQFTEDEEFSIKVLPYIRHI